MVFQLLKIEEERKNGHAITINCLLSYYFLMITSLFSSLSRALFILNFDLHLNPIELNSIVSNGINEREKKAIRISQLDSKT